MSAEPAHDEPPWIRAKRRQIETALDRIRPLLQEDGVTISLVDVRVDGASFRVTGAATCDSAPLNFQAGLEEMLREEIEGFRDVRLV